MSDENIFVKFVKKTDCILNSLLFMTKNTNETRIVQKAICYV